MDTFAEITCYSSDRESASKAMKDAFGEMERIEEVFSKFDEKSEVSRINSAAGLGEIVVSPEVFKIIEDSIYYSRLSDGSFDITVGPSQKGRYKDIVLDRNKLSVRFLDKDIKIDLGGIVKGYAVDRAKDILVFRGIENALISIGGNIFALGSPPRKDSWRIGIRDPKSRSKIMRKLNLEDRAVSTSADYERPFHIIDPSSGKPSDEVMSVTIVANSAEEADALSTAVFVTGPERGLELVASFKDVEVFIVGKNSKLITYP